MSDAIEEVAEKDGAGRGESEGEWHGSEGDGQKCQMRKARWIGVIGSRGTLG